MNYLYFIDTGGKWVSPDIIRGKLHDALLAGEYVCSGKLLDDQFALICDYMLGYLDDASFDAILAERFERANDNIIVPEWPPLSANSGNALRGGVQVARIIRRTLTEYQLCEIE